MNQFLLLLIVDQGKHNSIYGNLLSNNLACYHFDLPYFFVSRYRSGQ